MADRVVVDASVALAYLRSEVGSVLARDAIVGWSASNVELLVPAHFWIEVTHVLGRHRGFHPADVLADYVNLDHLGLQTIELDRPMLLLALDQMARSGLSAYDAVYLALALSTESVLATLDRRLAEAAGHIGLLIGVPGAGRISDQRAEYRVSKYDGWAHTATVGHHIAELRLRALTGVG